MHTNKSLAAPFHTLPYFKISFTNAWLLLVLLQYVNSFVYLPVYLFGTPTEESEEVKLRVAVAKAQRADADLDVPTASNYYKQAIISLSRPVLDCVRTGLLPKTAYINARQLEVRMQLKLELAIRNAKRGLRDAMKTRDLCSLAVCLDKQMYVDALIREPCEHIIASANALSTDLRAEAVRKVMVDKGTCMH